MLDKRSETGKGQKERERDDRRRKKRDTADSEMGSEVE